MVMAEFDKIKIELINWIQSLEDDSLIGILESIRLSAKSKGGWNDLSDWEKGQIEAGRKDVEEGRVMSSPEFWKRVRSKLVE